MSDKKSLLKEIKSLVFGEEKVLSFLDAKSGDLIVRVEADAFAPELPLLIVTPEGAIPAEDGEYVLEDGTILEVATGVIKEVSSADEDMIPEEETAVEELGIETPMEPIVDETAGATASVEEVEEIDMNALMERLAKCEEAISNMGKSNEKMNEFSKIVGEKIDLFIEGTPAEIEFKSVKAEFVSTIESNKNKVVNSLESINNIRKK
jgi:hypothetical protein